MTNIARKPGSGNLQCSSTDRANRDVLFVKLVKKCLKILVCFLLPHISAGQHEDAGPGRYNLVKHDVRSEFKPSHRCDRLIRKSDRNNLELSRFVNFTQGMRQFPICQAVEYKKVRFWFHTPLFSVR